MKPHSFHPEAEEEYAEATRYYAAIQPELGGRFYDVIERLIHEIRREPGRFRLFDPPARRHLDFTFPHAVSYLDQPGRVWIVAIIHCKRRPGYWRERIDQCHNAVPPGRRGGDWVVSPSTSCRCRISRRGVEVASTLMKINLPGAVRA